jgi:hypothetical protein
MGLVTYRRMEETRAPLYIIIFFVPIVGALIAWVNYNEVSRKKTGVRKIGMEKIKVLDVKYKRIEVSSDEDDAKIVPLEEAIAINDERTRRTLMLDILRKNPEEHIELMQRARLTNDTELTHYATTTMMELQSGYEQVINELEEARNRLPDDVGILKKLRRELKRYIESGLLTGNILTIYQKKLGDVLDGLLKAEPENKKYCLDRIENSLNQGKRGDVLGELERAEKKWPDEERVYRLMVSYYHSEHRGDMVQQVMDKIERNNVYLSNEGKQWFAFWRGQELI